MDKNVPVDAVYTDFSKAFDKVYHDTLFNKLRCVFGNLLTWIKSDLTNRSQYVVIMNCRSKLRRVFLKVII